MDVSRIDFGNSKHTLLVKGDDEMRTYKCEHLWSIGDYYCTKCGAYKSQQDFCKCEKPTPKPKPWIPPEEICSKCEKLIHPEPKKEIEEISFDNEPVLERCGMIINMAIIKQRAVKFYREKIMGCIKHARIIYGLQNMVLIKQTNYYKKEKQEHH